jgi:hypothetical protein
VPSLRRWLRSHPRLAAALFTGALVASFLGLLVLLWPPNPITRANFDRIRVGMSQAELYGLLGAPQYQTVESGLVEGPETYATNRDQSDEERRRRGFREYRRQQWTSSEVTIIVISEPQGRVVCRYSGDGQTRDWLAFLRSWLP